MRNVVAAAVAAAFVLAGSAAEAGDRWHRGHGYGYGYGQGHGGPPPWAHGGKGWRHRGDWYGGPRTVIVEPRRRWHAPPPPRWPPPGITVTIPFPYR